MKESVRVLLRDTALEAAMLAEGAETPSAPILMSRCVEMVEGLCRKMRAAAFPEEVIQEVSYAQCALLDEAALRRLPEAQRGDWEVQPLQVRFFKTYNAGEAIYDRVESLLRKAEPSQDLLESYSVILGLGFLGRYFKIDDEERARLAAEIDLRLAKAPEAAPLFVLGRGDRGEAFDWRGLSPLWWLGLAAVIPLILWFILDHRLDGRIEQLLTLGA